MFDIRKDPPVLKLVQVSVDTRTNRELFSVPVAKLYSAGNFRAKVRNVMSLAPTVTGPH